MRAVVGLLVLVACEELVVEPVPVWTVTVLPSEAEILVGDAVQLTAQPSDENGDPLADRTIAWSSSDDGVAAVDGNGEARGMSGGLAVITASVEGQSATATITVLDAPRIELGQQSVSFSAPEGIQDPPPIEVGVTNGGAGVIEGLATVIAYEGEATGWLEAALTSRTAPTTLILTAHAAGLDPGDYAGTVRVTDPAAVNSPVALAVGFRILQNPPAAPTELELTAVTGTAIALRWTDNSDDETYFQIDRRGPASNALDSLTSLPANTTSYRDGGVAPDGRYGYRVKACNDAGCSLPSNEAAAPTPPTAPSELAAEATGYTTVSLAWSDNSVTETEFRIERRAAAGEYELAGTAAADATAFEDADLSDGEEYQYRVQACNGSGCSDFSGPASVATPVVPIPDAPSGLSATTVSAERVDLAWSDNSGNETSFQIDRASGDGAFARLATADADAESYSDASTSADTEYRYRVTACNQDACSDASNVATATTPPRPVSGLTVTPLSTSTLALSWSDNSNTETEVAVERRTGGSDFSEIAALGADATGYQDEGLETATTYEYRVIACNDGGCAAPSAVASGTTLDVPPAAPTGLSIVSTGDTQIGLAWTDNATNESEYRIERARNGGAFGQIATTSADAESYSDTAISDDSEYAYRVRACNSAGCSAYSNSVATVTPPSAPSGLTATAVSHERIDLDWNDNSDTETSFRVYRRVAGGSWSLAGSTGAGVTGFVVDGLTHSTDYEFRVQACNQAGCSALSGTAAATTPPPPPPIAPRSLTATLASSGSSVALSWNDVSSDETLFRVHRSVDGGSFAALLTTNAGVSSATDTDIDVDHRYAYVVEACNTWGCSGFSNEAGVVTEPSAPSSLSASVASTERIDLAWSDNSSVEDGFEIQRSVDGGSFSDLDAVGDNVESYADNGVSEDTRYAYRVRSCNAAGCSAFSASASATTPPSSPSRLSAAAISGSTIVLLWVDTSDTETGFRVERERDDGTYGTVGTAGANGTTYVDTGLDPGTTYRYRIRACNDGGCSAPSGTASATTPFIPLPQASGPPSARPAPR